MRSSIIFFLIFFLISTAFGQAELKDREVLSKAWKEYNGGDLHGAEKLFESIKDSKDKNTSLEAFMGLGYISLRKNEYDKAKKIFQLLVDNNYNSEKTIPALIDVCIGTKDFERLKTLLDKIPEKDRKKVKKIILYHEINAAKEGSEKRMEAALELLKMDNKDSFALSVAAWHSYNNEKYEEALKYFKTLYGEDRSDEKILLWIGYCLIKLNRYDEALLLVEKNTGGGNRKVNDLLIDLFKRIVDKAYSEGQLAILERYLRKILNIDPFDNFAVTKYSELYCKRGERKKALSFIYKTYDLKKNPSYAFTLLSVLDNSGFKSEAFKTAQLCSESDEKSLKEAASAYLFSKNYPVSASMADQSSDKSYSNAYSSRIDGSYYHRHRSGDNGTSRLEEDAVPLGFTISEGFGRQWFVTVKSGHLDSGSAVTKAGTYYRYLNGDENQDKLGNRVTYTVVSLGMEKEGVHSYSLLLGTSPILTDVGVTPVFNLLYSYSSWEFDLHRSIVGDSILSYCGLDDPYSDDSWGRVIKNGAVIGNTLNLDKYWLSVRTGFDWYTGENVWNNASRQLDLAAGRTFTDLTDTELTFGLFFTYLSFDRNSNYYTYGHGGYFSPQSLFVTGPLVRIKTKPYRKYWIDLSLSCGWMEEKTEDSPFYPVSNETSSLNSPALTDYNSVYEGSKNSGVAFSMKFEGWKLLSDKNFSLGTYFHLNQSPGYNEWKAGFAFEYTFKPWNSFWKRENIDRRFTIR